MNLTTKYLLIALIYIIAYIYSIVLAPKIAASTSPVWQSVNKVHESCILNCSVAKPILDKTRGPNYYIGEENDPSLNNCLMTFWSLSHMFFYAILGAIFPEMFWETMTIGVGFELYEKYTFGCEDYLDFLVYNPVGFGIGYLLRRKIIDKYLLR
ncbi:Hypothetical protein PACV_452 [Pacmanvirus A23]|uniref:Hypothetical protein n=1 Tax=Pacmanvirus A23 TaxID=1932881 RepID=UPI000A095A79|nr:Hypothetical protein B9W72_gp448 [Pacmanvirus A23]SIP86165.1 Hypothetical protein PACV_452 [Pacmanvirus A23]